jgi:hypothetical protein
MERNGTMRNVCSYFINPRLTLYIKSNPRGLRFGARRCITMRFRDLTVQSQSPQLHRILVA